MSLLLVSLLGSALLSAVSAQFVTAPTDLLTKKGYADISVRYKDVPAGICELDPTVKSFSGYADVAENEHIFFWFFEARNTKPSEAPLTVWINGGPGSSSMIGLFQENGPCGVDIDGKVYNNPYSWSNASNMLFIDQPTQTGFSYSIPIPGYLDPNTGEIVKLPDTTCPDHAKALGTCGTYSTPNLTLTANSTAAAAPNLWKTLQGFMGAFPQYSRNEFHFSTESYGGHYGPVFNEYIETQNAKNIPGAHKINLASVIIGNGWYDPILQYQAYYNYTVFPGNTYDFAPYNKSISKQLYNNLYGPGKCVEQLQACAASGLNKVCNKADVFCYEHIELPFDNILGRDEYDARELSPDPFPYGFYVAYLNKASVQKAIGAFQNYSESSGAVGTAFGSTGDDGRKDHTIEDVAKLLAQNVTVLMYAGDADYNCNWLGGEAVAAEIGAKAKHSANAPSFAAAGYVNICTSDAIVHGQVKQSGLLSFARIYDSGHEVPFYQPVVALEIFERAIGGKDIATGRKHVEGCYLTHGTRKSTYRQGNSTIQYQVLPRDATYNTTTNMPDPSGKGLGAREVLRRSGRSFKPGR